MNEDAILLRRYLEESSEEAFTQLVHKYLNLVYAAALRRTGGNPHRAADVAQEVFTALARQARTLREHPALGAWLHTASRNLAVNLMMSEQRRVRRQQTSVELEAVETNSAETEWEKLRPVLDQAIDELPEPDRHAVVLRFLERRAFKEIGAVLRVSEDAARVRTERALEKLRSLLAQRGITSTAGALGAVVTSHAAATAPAGLATVLAAKSFVAAAGGGGLAGITAFMSTKVITTAAVSALAAFALGSYVSGGRAAAPTPAIAAVSAAMSSESEAALRRENQRLTTEMARLNADLRDASATNARLLAERAAAPSETGRAVGVLGAPLPKYQVQRAVLNNLRQFAAALDQYRFETKHWPKDINELVGATAYIRRLVPVDGEDYTKLALNTDGELTITTANGVTVTYAAGAGTTTPIELPPPVARAEELGKKIDAARQAATQAYRLANQGRDPKEPSALLPFFSTPQEGADFVEFLEVQKEAARVR